LAGVIMLNGVWPLVNRCKISSLSVGKWKWRNKDEVKWMGSLLLCPYFWSYV